MSLETEIAALTDALGTLTALVGTMDTSTQSAYNTAVSAAAASATAAAVSATNAAAVVAAANNPYLGAKASAPTLDNQGNALVVGAEYFNTVTQLKYVYNGSAWLPVTVSLSAPVAIGNVTPAAGTFTNLASTGNTTIGDASGDSLTLNAGTVTQASNIVQTRALGVVTGTVIPIDHEVTFSGSAGGSADVRSFLQKTTFSGANSAAQVTLRSPQLELTHTAGTVTFAYGDQMFIRLGRLGSSTGNVTSARGYEFHFANEGSGTIANAISFYGQDVDLIDGTGPINNIYGFKSGDLGHATRVPAEAIGHDANNMTAGAMTIAAGFRSKMTSGTNRWGFLATGNANNAFAGTVNIGAATPSATTLGVTGTAAISGATSVGGVLTVPGGVITTGSTTAMSLRTNAGEMARIIDVPSVANVLQIEAAITGNTVGIRPVGDTNASIKLFSSGAGSVYLGTAGGVNQVEVVNTTSANRKLTLTGSNGGNPAIGTTAGNIAITTSVEITGTGKVSTGLAVGGATPGTGGIAFPAAAVAVADANTLDDYEEGTWTPVITFTGGNGDLSTAEAVGTYTKIGRLVHVAFNITFSETTASGGLTITGVPFTAGGSMRHYTGCAVDNMTGISGAPVVYLNTVSTTLVLQQNGTGVAAAITSTNTGASSISRGYLSYTI